MRYYQKKASPQHARMAEPTVRRHEDGREVCLNNEAGRAEYESRKQQLWERQRGQCALNQLHRMSLADCRMTSGEWQETGQLRDDRIDNLAGQPTAARLVCKGCLRRWHDESEVKHEQLVHQIA